MSRSIHTNRRDYYNLARNSSGEANFIQKELEVARERLWRKGFVKKQRRFERKHPPYDISELYTHRPFIPEVSFEEETAYVHYPISKQDVYDSFKYLPPYILSGLEAITFCLGKTAQMHDYKIHGYHTNAEQDPYMNRYSIEILPNIYAGSVLGQYFVSNRPYDQKVSIRIYAYVFEEKAFSSALVSCYLKMLMLGTLLHEIAHHYDHTNRTARGRWLGVYEPTGKAEAYALQMQETWGETIIVPLLQQNYPKETAIFEEWVKNHPLVDVPMHLWIMDSFFRYLIEKTMEE